MIVSQYLEKTKNLPPSPLLAKAISLVQGRFSALDLGSGGGKDTKFLLDQGFQVTAVDKDPQVTKILSGQHSHPKLTFENVTFDKFNFGKYDLINAHFSLPFNPRVSFSEVWRKTKESLNPGGVFVGQFFGPTDSWNTSSSDMNFHTRAQVRNLLIGLEIVQLSEENFDGTTTLGTPKHWHVFHVIARNKA